jgi:hypothetical protein
MSSKQRNIQVVSSTLNNLVVAVERGDYRVPQFQREYVWERTKVIELFDSIYKEYPIGSFFLWKAGREHNRLFRNSVELNIPPVANDDDVSFILDGQQRITSIYVTLMGLTVQGTDYARICFDLAEEKFLYTEPNDRRFIRVADMWGENALKIGRRIEDRFGPAFDRCYEVLRTYPISIVEVRDQDLPAVCGIFQRINQSGKRLGRFDLISAMTLRPDFDLREKFRNDILARLNERSFGEIAPTAVTQLMALVKKGSCAERVEFSLTADDVAEMWPKIVRSILLAADTLRQCVGVQNAEYLPYHAQLTLLAYLYAKSGRRSLTDAQLDWVKKWFWRSSFAQHYGSGAPTKMGRDKDLFDALISGRRPTFDVAVNLTADVLVGTKMTSSASAVRNALLCLLAQRRPVRLSNNIELDLIDGGISDFTNPDKHRIFPPAMLSKDTSEEGRVHALPNFCFLPAAHNSRFGSEKPSKYIPELARENPRFAHAAHIQLIPTQSDSGLYDDDYVQFLQKRSQLIIDEVERLTGQKDAPPADERAKAIDHFENRLRDLIHSTLVECRGQDYWRSCIPNDIRRETEKRIAYTLRKQPQLAPEHFSSPRDKLNFCNVNDYIKIIAVNWDHFKHFFRTFKETERHFEAFADFRHTIMHNRPLTELTQRAGELALIWLGTVVPDASQSTSLVPEQREFESA